jgi:class 3 adenylate cyclase/tetratricopeptide (TPR) repeat protein
MRCSKCGSDNREGAKFCRECASPLSTKCAACGSLNQPGAKFCDECGASLDARPSRLAVSPGQPEIWVTLEKPEPALQLDGERKTVTALFADIKGSMELMEALDPEEARAIVDPALKLMIDAVHRYGGYIVQSTGDGIFALFGAPVAHEDHPQRALYAALRMQEEMRRYGDRMRTRGQTPLQVRVGVNTGEVVVRSIQTGADHTEYTPIGHSTGLAARLQTLATPGTTMISGSTRRLVEGFFQLTSLGPATLKGVTEQVDVYEVTGLGPLRTRMQRAAARGLTKFVGRQREMDALKHAAEQVQTGHGQIVAVMAEPGVGKSRLFHEFRATSQSGWMVLEAFSVSHGRASAYLPVLDLLSQYFEISRDDDDRKRRERVLGKVLGLDRTLEDTLPYLYSLLGIADTGDSLARMDPEIRRRRTQDAVKRILLRESINQPLMIIFEDLHWIDSETQALLNLLVDTIANARILLLVNYRPEYRHEWGSRTHYSQLRLDPLERESAEEMLSALLGDEKELFALKRLIIERTEGTPFFMEEMVQALFEEGLLQRDGTITLARPLSMVKVPGTVQAVLASRIDRLPAAEKELLQTLAVLGREFPLPLMLRVTARSRDELEQTLAQLQLGEFIYEQPAIAEVEYSFKHALTQEVAYNSILIDRRRVLHERTATALEQLYAHQLNDHYSDLAHHFLRGSDVTKAIYYAQLAAEQALNRGTYAEATSLVETALRLLDQLPEGNERLRAELALRSHQSVLVMVLYGGSSLEREQVIKRVCELGETIGETDQLLSGLINLCNLYFLRGEPVPGLELARRCLKLAEVTRDAGLLADAHYIAGNLSRSCGNLQEAMSHFEEAALQSSRTNRRITLNGFLYRTCIASNQAVALYLLGRVREALKVIEEAQIHARESKHFLSLGLSLTMTALLYRYRRDPGAVLLRAEEMIAVGEQYGFPEWLNIGQFYHGWSLTQLAQPDQGIAEMEAAIATFLRMRLVYQQHMVVPLAQSYANAGRTEEGLAELDNGLVAITRTGGVVEEPEILRLKGELLLTRRGGEIEQAEAPFRAALEVARSQGSKWWELRSTVSLARLLRDTDRRDEARTLLSEIYNWFTEGLELPDLREAKALLDELSC